MTNQTRKLLHSIRINGCDFRTQIVYNIDTHHIGITTARQHTNYKSTNFKRSTAKCIICGKKLHGRQRKYCSKHKHKAHKQQMKDNYENNKCKWLCESGKYHDDLLERNRNNVYI